MATYINFDQKDDGTGYIARVVDTDTKAETARFDIPITEGRNRKELEKAVEKRLNPSPVEPAPVVTAKELARVAYRNDVRLVRQYQSAAALGIDALKGAEYVAALARLQSSFKPEYIGLF